MKENLFNKAHKDNQNPNYQANYDQTFSNCSNCPNCKDKAKIQAPEMLKVERSNQG